MTRNYYKLRQPAIFKLSSGSVINIYYKVHQVFTKCDKYLVKSVVQSTIVCQLLQTATLHNFMEPVIAKAVCIQ